MKQQILVSGVICDCCGKEVVLLKELNPHFKKVSSRSITTEERQNIITEEIDLCDQCYTDMVALFNDLKVNKHK